MGCGCESVLLPLTVMFDTNREKPYHNVGLVNESLVVERIP